MSLRRLRSKVMMSLIHKKVNPTVLAFYEISRYVTDAHFRRHKVRSKTTSDQDETARGFRLGVLWSSKHAKPRRLLTENRSSR